MYSKKTFCNEGQSKRSQGIKIHQMTPKRDLKDSSSQLEMNPQRLRLADGKRLELLKISNHQPVPSVWWDIV